MVPVFLIVSIGLEITKRVVKVQVKKHKNKKYVAALEATNSQHTGSDITESLPLYAEKELMNASIASISSMSSKYSQSIEESELIGVANGKLSSLDIDFSKVTKIVVNHGKSIHYISFMDALGNSVYKIGKPNYAQQITAIQLPDPTELITQIKCFFNSKHMVGITFVTNKTRVESAGITRKGKVVNYEVPADSNIVGIELYCSKIIHTSINGLRFMSASA